MEALRWMRLSAASESMDWSRSGVPPLPFRDAGSVLEWSFSAMAGRV